MSSKTPVVLFYCEHTSRIATRSGIQRVVIEAALALASRTELYFVKWDSVDGQLRYFDNRDLEGLFGNEVLERFIPHKACHRVAYRFGDTIDSVDDTWLLYPELPYFQTNGNAIFSTIVSQCREYKVRTAAIFYDLIPVREAEYASSRVDHFLYIVELLRCDKIFAISRFAADDLLAFFQETASLIDVQLNLLRERVVPVLLGERRVEALSGVTPLPNTKTEPDRTWGDYADELIDQMVASAVLEREQEILFRHKVLSFIPTQQCSSFTTKLYGVTWTVAFDALTLRIDIGLADRSSGHSAFMMVLGVPPAQIDLSHKDAVFVLSADILICTAPLTSQSVVDLANHHAFDELLPADIITGTSALQLGLDAAIRISKERRSAHQMSVDSCIQASLMRQFTYQMKLLRPELAIVISTFNRASFVSSNVAWVLEQIDHDDLPVSCIVVDNASTDDTCSRLNRFVTHPKFTLIQNANNTGILGNLRVCSAGLHATHIWMTGDDNFILPGAIQRTLKVIRQHPSIPLLIHNYGVYHREKFSLRDSPAQFVREMIELTSTPQSEGIHSINEIAGEHDNLFTAIYPIVFRSDVLSACFNYPFDGVPFGNLIESVPTTKIILGTYRYCDAYWFAESGIVGNAHNSWSKHRPRWHLVLMPQVFQLAREAGVDPRKIWLWTQAHKQLFDEAMDVSINLKVPAHIDLPKDIQQALIIFRERVDIDKRLITYSVPPIPLWQLAQKET